MNEQLAKSIYLFLQSLRREDIAGILGQLEESQWYPEERLLDEQWNRFKSLIQYAYENSPYYRKRFIESGMEPGDIKSRDDIKAIPILTKAEIKDNIDDIRVPGYDTAEKLRTSGSTGEPLVVYRCRASTGHHRANMFRQRRWFGSDIGSFEAMFKTFNYPLAERLRVRVKDIVLNRIRINERELTDRTMLDFYNKIRHYKPGIFYGFPSLIIRFANFLKGEGLELKLESLNAIISTGEVIERGNKKFLSDFFDAPAVDEYGCTEVGIIAMECPEGSWHVPVESCLLEIVPRDETGIDEDGGRVVVTDLWNKAMPIIRYDNGDLAREKPGGCPCGRGLPSVESVVGRVSRMVDLPDGRSIHTITFSKIFKNAESVAEGSIKEFQLRFRPPDEFNILIVPDKNFNDQVMAHLRERLDDVLGQGSRIDFKLVNEIPGSRNGKLEKFIIIRD